MPRAPHIYHIHRDEMLMMMGCMPVKKAGEEQAAFERRKAAAATQAQKDYGLEPMTNGKRARIYREDEVIAAQQKNVKRIAA